jgi:hypothetical protein
MARFAVGVLVAALLAAGAGEGAASAQAPPPGATAAPASAPAPPAAARGAIVVAVGDDASAAARPLAQEVYRDDALRPSIDEATARVLTGSPPPEGASAKLKDLAELRASIPRAGSDTASRRLLASLGTELGVALVVAVSVREGKPVASLLRPAAGAFEPVQLAPTAETAPDGTTVLRWPGVLPVLRTLVPATPSPAGAGAEPKAGPLRPLASAAEAPKPKAAPAEPKPMWKSLWFWGAAGGVVAVAVSIFAVSKATQGSSDVHLEGRVGQ